MRRTLSFRLDELRRALLVLGLVGSCLAVTTSLRAEDSGNWEKVRVREGIESFRRQRPSQALDAFRARMWMEADLWTALAVLEDVDRAQEWTSHCLEMRKLSGVSERDMLVYARTDAPWPVRDRDVVTRVTTTVLTPRDVVIEIHAVPHAQEHPSVVRIPALDARYAFHQREDGRLEVEYAIEVDPGGTLPDWLKNLVGRDLAHETLLRLRERTAWALAEGVYTRRAQRLRAIAGERLARAGQLNSELTLTNAAP